MKAPKRPSRSTSSLPHFGHGIPVGFGSAFFSSSSERVLRQTGYAEQPRNRPNRFQRTIMGLPHSVQGSTSAATTSRMMASPFSLPAVS